MTRVLFVCMGNICRSPTAEAVFRRLAAQRGLLGELEIDSAGTHGYHVGESPDARTQRAAAERKYDLSLIRARKVAPEDLEYFDLVLAMDRSNLEFAQQGLRNVNIQLRHLFVFDFLDGVFFVLAQSVRCFDLQSH